MRGRGRGEMDIRTRKKLAAAAAAAAGAALKPCRARFGAAAGRQWAAVRGRPAAAAADHGIPGRRQRKKERRARRV